ncbi:TetR/AcrR family transcriptional regulator [Microvirga sp. Mcv34]|uniref:TetR/AcrR family transcriptional regulator n=1 Tax=Microvirga sp. Mcv34 TaxID=2926016 RepID=UPI0021C7134C|nr:TetR/AcrR family transcriptional regulator [Microvirga sp. Mcv34]
MLECRRGRRRSRDKILDAAAELIREIGSGRLTLDGVAERAGLSKGGLLYNFPTKEALLQAMIQRLIDEVQTEKELLRETEPAGPNLEARLQIGTCLKMRKGKMREIATGMLAASSENPSLLDPVRKVLRSVRQDLKRESDDPEAALLAWLAVEGLNSMTMHNISPFSEDDCEMIGKAAQRLLDKGIAR